MIADDLLRELALRLKTAQDHAARLAPLTATLPLDVASAYAVADAVHRLRLADGAVPVGRKIGFTNPSIWDEYGVHQPIWGWMYEHTVRMAEHGHALLALSPYAEPKIEPEIVVRFASSPPTGADPVQVLGCIDWIAHGFEIVQSHFPGWNFKVADTMADGGLHGALVVGEPVPLAALGDDPLAVLSSFEVDLACDGVYRETGRGSNVLGSPVAAIVHLLGVLADSAPAASIRAGEIITTGTLTAAHSIQAGEKWSTSLRGIALPGLTLDLVS